MNVADLAVVIVKELFKILDEADIFYTPVPRPFIDQAKVACCNKVLEILLTHKINYIEKE